MKKLITILVAAAMLLGLVACGSSSQPQESSAASSAPAAPAASASTSSSSAETSSAAAPEASGPIHVNVGVSDLIASWSPWIANNAGRASVIAGVFQPIVECDKDHAKAVCVLAESIEKIDDLTFRCYLHQDIYDSEGNHFTAEDAVFTLTNFVEAGTVSASKAVDHVEFVDEYTFDVFMKEGKGAEGVFAEALSQGWCVTKAAWEASTDEMSNDPVGTGGYRVVDFVPSATVDLEKVENYWGTGKVPQWLEANADTVHLEQIAEPSQLTIALEGGIIDMAPLFPASELEYFVDREGFTVYPYADYSPGILYFNLGENSPCKDLKLRQAIAYAIDVQQLIDGALNGYGDVCGTFGANNMADYFDSWNPADYYAQDLEKAKQLLDESGYDTSKPLKFMVNNISERKKVAEIIQLQLSEIGLSVDLKIYDTATYSQYRLEEGEWDVRLDYSGSGSLIEWWDSYLSSNSRDEGVNWMFFADPDLDALLEEASIPENFANEKTMTAAKDYINDNVYGYGLFSTTVFYVTVDTITYPGHSLKNKPVAGGSTFAPEFGQK